MPVVTFGKYRYSTPDADESASSVRERILGHGGQGAVYVGHHIETGAIVAIKEDFRATVSKKKYKQEMRLLKVLMKVTYANDNLMKIFAYGTTMDGSPFNHLARFCSGFVPAVKFTYAMEYCNYGDLGDFLRRFGPQSQTVLRHFFRQIAQAMRVLHSHNIIQRDMKLGNILLHDPRHRRIAPPTELVLKVSDYGLSRVLSKAGDASTCCGTAVYLAPELWNHPLKLAKEMPKEEAQEFLRNAGGRRHSYDDKADLFSVGVVLYICLTGRHPFLYMVDGNEDRLGRYYRESSSDDMTSHIVLASAWPLTLRMLICGLLQKDPAERIDFDQFYSHAFFEDPEKDILSFMSAFAAYCFD